MTTHIDIVVEEHWLKGVKTQSQYGLSINQAMSRLYNVVKVQVKEYVYV